MAVCTFPRALTAVKKAGALSPGGHSLWSLTPAPGWLPIGHSSAFLLQRECVREGPTLNGTLNSGTLKQNHEKRHMKRCDSKRTGGGYRRTETQQKEDMG